MRIHYAYIYTHMYTYLYMHMHFCIPKHTQDTCTHRVTDCKCTIYTYTLNHTSPPKQQQTRLHGTKPAHTPTKKQSFHQTRLVCDKTHPNNKSRNNKRSHLHMVSLEVGSFHLFPSCSYTPSAPFGSDMGALCETTLPRNMTSYIKPLSKIENGLQSQSSIP